MDLRRGKEQAVRHPFEPLGAGTPGELGCHGFTVGPGVSVYSGRHPPCLWTEHQHDAAEICLAMESARGRMTWKTVDGPVVSQSVADGDVCFIPPGVPHAKEWLSEAVMIVLYTSPAWLGQFDLQGINRATVVPLSELAIHDPLIAAVAESIRAQPAPANAGQIAALGHCLAARVVAGLTSRMVVATGPSRKLGTCTMKRVTDYVEAHACERISLSMLAREARLSPGYFSTLFKATSGMTPEQYILRTRLTKAKAAIETGAYTISEVAYLTGFADHSHLTTQFKRRFGAPPKAFLPATRFL